MNEPLPNLLRRARDLHASGSAAYACLVVNSRGSTPQTAGALMLLDDSGRTYGTIGGGCVEAEVRSRALELLAQRRSGLLTFKLDHDYGWDDGLICGGTIDVAVAPFPPAAALDLILAALASRIPASLDLLADHDPVPARFTLHLRPPQRLLIAGAGHVGQALARMALTLEFEVFIFDDRSDLLAAATPAGATAVTGDIASCLSATPVDDSTFCVIVTRGHKHDEQALAAVVNRGARYIGMIGSRRKVKLIFDDLRAMGIPQPALDAVYAPVGVPIGSVTVEEIAVSIAAQLVQARRSVSTPLVTRHSAEPTSPPLVCGHDR